MPAMTSPYRNKPGHRPTPKSEGGILLRQLVVGGLLIAVGGILAGIKIAEMILPLWLPGLAR
jgi:hypothetical protein